MFSFLTARLTRTRSRARTRTRTRTRTLTQAHVFSYLTAPRSVGATPLPLTATTDFLALATTCSSAWAIYSAGREALWRSALSHRVKVRGGPADRDWRALHRLLCATLDDGIEALGWADDSNLENAAEVRHAWWRGDVRSYDAETGLVKVRSGLGLGLEG